MRTTIYLMMIMFLSLPIGSCDREDGDWDPISFSVDGKKIKGAEIDVPVEGGTYKVKSTNYGLLWLTGVHVNGENAWPKAGDWSNFRNDTIRQEWGTIHYDSEDNTVVEILHNHSTAPREIELNFECGDAFRDLIITQKANAPLN